MGFSKLLADGRGRVPGVSILAAGRVNSYHGHSLLFIFTEGSKGSLLDDIPSYARNSRIRVEIQGPRGESVSENLIC